MREMSEKIKNEVIIEMNHLTKNYGNGKGIFQVNLSVRQGEVFGFLGPNGAGKTTTIRNLMGFIKPDEGSVKILGMDCFQEADQIQSNLGYLAGEIAFLDDLSGKQLISFIASMKGIKDYNRMNELMERFELDPRNKLRKMSKGMKQKVGIICAFMGNPDIIILDEPTSGLDPLMQNRFVDLILEEKKKGKTIFMSSHIFEEIEKTCDRTAMIKDGKIIAIEDMEDLKHKKSKIYMVTLQTKEEAEAFQTCLQGKECSNEGFRIVEINNNQVSVKVKDVQGFLLILANYKVKDLETKVQSLEELFLHYYGGAL